MTKERSGKLPTSFNLEPELVQRLREICPRLRTKISPFVESVLAEAVERAEAGLAGAPATKLVPFPDLLASLSDDDVWLLHQLVGILRDRPQGDIFQILETALHKAAKAYVAQTGNPAPPKFGEGNRDPRKVKSLLAATEADYPWLEILIQVLHSKKPGLPTAVQNNLHEFAWADEAWTELERQKSPLVSAPAPRGGRRRGASGQLTEIAATGVDPRDNREGTTRSSQELDAVEKAQEGSHQPAKRTPGKTR